MERITISCKIILALIFCGTFAEATYQPITGSTVTVMTQNNNTTALPVSVSGTPSVTISGTPNVSFNGIAQPVSLTGIPLNPSGVNASTVAVVNGASALNATINSALPSGTNNLGTVSGSTVTILTSANGNLPVSVNNTPSVTISGTPSVNSYNQGTTTVTFNGTGQPVTGTFFQATQPVSVATPYQVYTSTSGQYASTTTVIVSGIPAVSQSGTWNIGTLTTLTGITNALPAGVNNIGTVSGSSVTIYTPNNNTTAIPVSVSGSLTANQSVNLNQVSGSAVTTSGNAGEQRISVEIQGSSNTVQGGLSNNGAAATGNRATVLPGIAQNSFGNNGSAYTTGRDAAVIVLSSSGLLGVSVQSDNTFSTYSASTMSFTVSNTTADITGLCGNTSKTVEVMGLQISCIQTTAGIIPVSLALRSSAYTGAWSTITAVGMDQQFAGASSTAMYQGTALINGTLVGYVDSNRFGCMAAATASPNDVYMSPAYWRLGTAVYLRGASQCLGANLQGTSVTGGTFAVNWIWKEVTTP